jgi:hypothetical protein
MKLFSKILGGALGVVSLHLFSASASFRIDLDNRSPEDVVKKSIHLGNTLGKQAGALLIVNEDDSVTIGTGILLDRRTVLTAAHLKWLEKAKRLEFRLGPNAVESSKEDIVRSTISGKPIVHETFSRKPLPDPLPLYEENGKLSIDGKPLNDYEDMSFEDFKTTTFVLGNNFTGVDLAILKLDHPVPEDYPFTYPTLIDTGDGVPNQAYGISVGFGTLKYNDQTKGPYPITLNDLDPCSRSHLRHLVSCKVSSGNVQDCSVLYGDYKSLFSNGSESFIPNTGMIQTEGLPTGGSSGGPLLMKINDQYRLVGIYSGTFAIVKDVIDDQEQRQLLNPYKVRIFPYWVNLQPYLSWIKSNMEQMQN